jgi:hypothetical protein
VQANGLIAHIPFTHQDPRLTAAGRRRLTAELAKPEMTAIIVALAAERTLVPPELRWRLRGDQSLRGRLRSIGPRLPGAVSSGSASSGRSSSSTQTYAPSRATPPHPAPGAAQVWLGDSS